MRSVVLNGTRWPMKEIHRRYNEQRDAERGQKQLTLFELRDDSRPASQKTAASRYAEPTLFTLD